MSNYKRIRFGSILGKDKILLFGDDIVTARVLGKILKRRGYIFTRIKEPENIINQVREHNPRMVILDYDFSGVNSLKLCKNLKSTRQTRHIPVVVLVDKNRDIKYLVKLLKSGAEDYIFKPLNVELFLAKIMTILRRRAFQEEPAEILKSKYIVLNLTHHRVTVNNKEVKLSPKEFALLYFLMKRKGQVLNRKTLMRNVWEKEYFNDMNTVNIHISSLRKKLGPAGKYIEPVEGIGYRLKI